MPVGLAEAERLGHVRQELVILLIEVVADLVEDRVAGLDEGVVKREYALLRCSLLDDPVIDDHIGPRDDVGGGAFDLGLAGVPEVAIPAAIVITLKIDPVG